MGKVVVGYYVVPVIDFYQELLKLFLINVERFEHTEMLKYLNCCCTKFLISVMVMVEVKIY